MIMGLDILFGSAYYLEYMPYDRLKEDIKMMKDAGMNIIRIAESTWSTLEPSSGKYDFTYIDRVLDILEKEDMKAIIGTPTYAIPSWLVSEDSDIMVTTKEGQAKYGHRQLMNIVNKTFRFYSERIIRKLIQHTAHRSCIIGFQIDNETKHYGIANEYVQKLFKDYLIEKFKTTEKFNKVFGLAYWSNSIERWDDLPDMRGCINGGLASEFEKFQRRLAAQYLMWQSEIIKEYKREDQFITHNFDFQWKKFGADIAQDGYSYGVQPDINHNEASRSVTIAGTDIYHPTQDNLTGAEIAFCGDEIRSLKNDNYFVLECQAQAFKYWTPYPGQLRLHAYSHLANGANGIMYWNWHSIHNGYETYWKGLLSHDLQSNPTYEEACVLGKELKEVSKDLIGLKKKNKVAFIIDNESLTAFKWFPIDKDLSYNDVVRWMYDSLYEINIECDVVFAKDLDIEKYKVIITPALYSIDEEFIYKLKSFVENGGVLLSSFKSFVSNEHLSVYHDKHPHILNECFGITYNQFTEPGKATIDGNKVEYWAELLNLEGAESLYNYEHKYWSKYSAITKNKYGQGYAYYIGCYINKEIIKEIYINAFKTADLLKDIPKVSWPVIIRNGENSKGNKLHYVLHYSEENNILKCPYDNVKDILTGKCYKKDDIISLHDWDVKILEEQ